MSAFQSITIEGFVGAASVGLTVLAVGAGFGSLWSLKDWRAPDRPFPRLAPLGIVAGLFSRLTLSYQHSVLQGFERLALPAIACAVVSLVIWRLWPPSSIRRLAQLVRSRGPVVEYICILAVSGLIGATAICLVAKCQPVTWMSFPRGSKLLSYQGWCWTTSFGRTSLETWGIVGQTRLVIPHLPTGLDYANPVIRTQTEIHLGPWFYQRTSLSAHLLAGIWIVFTGSIAVLLRYGLCRLGVLSIRPGDRNETPTGVDSDNRPSGASNGSGGV